MSNIASRTLDFGRDQPALRKLTLGDLRIAMRKGIADFSAMPSHAIFLILIYPVIGLIIARMTTNSDLMPLFFPLVAGFALLGPFAALGLYELSKERERGEAEPHWRDVLNVLRSPALGSIIGLGAVLMWIFVAWLLVARWLAGKFIAGMTMDSYGHFIAQVLTTQEGWAMIVVGNLIGFVFAVGAFAISAISFPLLLDRNVGLFAAMATSVRVVVENPIVMGLWGLFIAAALVVGSLPFFIGLALVMPVFGHATWHLYRRAVV
jgi:uncharacterized membrane protein